MFVLLATVAEGLATRHRILDAVVAQPGITKNQLRQRLGVNWRTVDHHVRHLAKDGILVQLPSRNGTKDVWCHHLFASQVPPPERIWFSHLARDASAEVIADLATRPSGTYGLRDATGKDRQTMWKTVMRLVRDGVVVKRGQTRPRYALAAPPPGLETYLAHLREGEAPAAAFDMPPSTPELQISGLRRDA